MQPGLGILIADARPSALATRTEKRRDEPQEKDGWMAGFDLTGSNA